MTLLAALVGSGTTYGYIQWQDDVAVATASDLVSAAPAGSSAWSPGDPTPGAAQPSASVDEVGTATRTFRPLTGRRDGQRPVVLLVGDGYADGQGASSAGTSYASLLARELGWDIRLATARGAGYVSGSPTLLDLFAASPVGLDPELVLVQGGYGAAGSDATARAAIEQLHAVIRERLGDVSVAVVTPFVMRPTEQAEARERLIARAWRTDPAVLLVRPQLGGWGVVDTRGGTPGDRDHARIAAGLHRALRAAGLARR